MIKKIVQIIVLLLISLGNRRLNDWLVSFLSPLDRLKLNNDLFVYAMKRKRRR